MPKEKTVCISGYFDPFHIGHLEYIERAKSLGSFLIVIVNNDQQAILKKKAPFMTCEDRCLILSALRSVDMVVPSIDKDHTVCKTLASLCPRPNVFCNGGDQFNTDIPEASICEKLGIELVDGLGKKIQFSSWAFPK